MSARETEILMPEVEATKEKQEFNHGLTFRQFTYLMLSTKVFNEIYRENYPDADQHTIEQMYFNIRTIGVEEKTSKALEKILNKYNEEVEKVANNNEQAPDSER